MSDGRVALVTGGAGGMGQAIVVRLVADGFRVAAMDVNEARLDEVVAKGGDAVKGWLCDQTVEADVRKTVAAIETDMGPIEALVNTIGWAGTTRFHEEDSDYWRKVIAINFEAVLYATHPVLLGMIDRKRGKIVHIASDAGRVGTSGEAVYAAMKGGIIAFTKSLARENARYNIHVNAVAPGPTETRCFARR